MASTRRRKSLDLTTSLQRTPYAYDFFQAVRLLERQLLEQESCKGFDSIRFKASNSLAFNGSDITQISKNASHEKIVKGESSGWVLEVALMGLTGSQGVLPYYYSELLTSELRSKSAALKDFFDIFNHRAISLYYGAWKKYQMPVVYESERLQKKQDMFTESLLSLSGLGGTETRFRTALADESLSRFAAHLGRNVCSAELLRSCISEMFNLDVQIEQFKGEWFNLDEDSRCQLPSSLHLDGVNNTLGLNTVLGGRCYQVQNKFTLVIVPRNEEEFNLCSPGSKFLEKLKCFVRLSVGVEQDFDIEIRVFNDNVSLGNICNPDNTRLLLGWNTVTNPKAVNKNSFIIRLSQDVRLSDDSIPLAH